jgi:hypothetical protein
MRGARGAHSAPRAHAPLGMGTMFAVFVVAPLLAVALVVVQVASA